MKSNLILRLKCLIKTIFFVIIYNVYIIKILYLSMIYKH